ncbi:DUF2927 domain-containing protein [Rhodobacterales bacterium LSUCC0031]|nr:DUF2927 domain-containing protein [Rhodobacterales bacterium LSUCC0031]
MTISLPTHRIAPLCAFLLVLLAGCMPAAPGLHDVANRSVAPEALGVMPPMRQFGSPRPLPSGRSNAQTAQDFLELSFMMESGRPIPRLTRFEGPVSVTITPGAPASALSDLDRLIARLRQEARIDIRRTAYGEVPANITIETLPRVQMQRVVPQAACFVVPGVSSWSEFRRNRNSRIMDWTRLETRTQVAVFIPNDVAPQEIRDCLHEEVAQALGPLNDLYRLADSVFNDDNFNAVLTGFDMLILRAYYDDALRSGMTRNEVAAALPAILARINPSAPQGGAAQATETPRAWITAIETALGPGTPEARRSPAAAQAVEIARQAGLTDARLAFSYFALGRLSLAENPEQAAKAFLTARDIYGSTASGRIHTAHIDMQLAAFALSTGRFDDALRLTAAATPAAMQAENAALLSTLLMIRAEALDALGRSSEAQQVRLDSLGWGRYGFGSHRDVGARLTEIAALTP